VNDLPLMILEDANASFQLVYVKDVALAIQQCISLKAYNKIYNVIAPERLQYDDIYNTLKECSKKHIIIKKCSINEAIQNNYPLPYPLTKYEEELYDGQRICQELGITYTPFKEGMEKTYQAFLPIFQ
jgi:nucleoside-diphosphate-sugar epimerase